MDDTKKIYFLNKIILFFCYLLIKSVLMLLLKNL